MKRWELRTSSLSAVTKADAGQNDSDNQLNPNALYMTLTTGLLVFSLWFNSQNQQWNWRAISSLSHYVVNFSFVICYATTHLCLHFLCWKNFNS